MDLPFTLDHLHYVSPRSWSEVPLPLFASLLHSVKGSASLLLQMDDELDKTSHIPFFEFDHPLTHLTLSALDRNNLVSLLPFFRRATKVETLEIDTHPAFIFEAIPNSLSTLKILEPVNLNFGSVVELLKQDLPSLAQLKRLEVESGTNKKAVRESTIQALCTKLDIVLDVTETEVSSAPSRSSIAYSCSDPFAAASAQRSIWILSLRLL